MLRFFVIVFLILYGFRIKAQDDRPMRVELEAELNSGNYHLQPFGKKGVLLYYQDQASFSGSSTEWVFNLYDINFKPVWTKKYSDNKFMKLRLQDKDDDNLYLFLQKAVNKNQKDDFTIVTVAISSGEIRSIKGINPDHSDVNQFAVYNGKAYCAGATVPRLGAEIGQVLFSLTLVPFFSGITLLNYHPSFFTVDLTSGNIISIKEKPKGQAWVESMEINAFTRSIFLTIKNHIATHKNFMYLNEYDANGTKLHSIELITNNNKRKLNTAKMINTSDSSEIIIGTYNNKVKGYGANAANNAFKEASTGIYFTRVENRQQQNILFYNFSDLKSFALSLNNKKALQQKKKEIRKKTRGKEFSYELSLLLHDIIKKDDQYIFIAEAYRPQYHNVSYTTYDAYGRPVTSSYTVFDGYRYSDALIMSFDAEGRLLWDNSFELKDVLSMRLSPKVEAMFSENELILTYSNEGEIVSKVIRGNQVVESNTATPIQTNYKNDKVLDDYNSDMVFWYGSYFISYGYQRIKNTSPGSKSKRTVFYFNKIGFY